MPLYVYECFKGHETEVVCMIDARPPAVPCFECGQRADRRICAPALHTLATFTAGIKDEVVERSRDPGDGSYFDPNLVDKKTGKCIRITSKKHREQVMAQLGVHERPPTDHTKDADKLKRTKPLWFS